MELYFVLDPNGIPVQELNPELWTDWYEKTNVGIARTIITSDMMVLTTFAGCIEVSEEEFLNGADAKPFETIVFGGPLDKERKNYKTKEEALAGHANMVEWCREALKILSDTSY